MLLSKTLEKFRHQINVPSVLYVDVYPYTISRDGDLFFLVLKRRNDVILPGDWQVVSGKIKEGEGIKDAFLRQVNSKTGQYAKAAYKLNYVNTFYDQHYDAVLMVPCAAVLLSSHEVHLDAAIHSEYRWVTYAEACDLLVWKNQRKCLDLVRVMQNNPEYLLTHRLVYDDNGS